MLSEHLIKNQVDLRYCPRVNGQTTLAFVSLEKGKSNEPQYAFYAEGAVDREMTTDDLPKSFEKTVSALHFGSISLVLEPGASTLEALMERESRQRIITLDPNVRPIVISNWQAYRERFEKWLSLVDILQLSLVDLKLIYPNESIEELLQIWFQKGLSLVIITRGTDGSTGYLPNGTSVYVPTQKVKVSDTVGAGDTYFSAVLTFLYDHDLLQNRERLSGMSKETLEACLAFATKAAAINCMRAGANPPYRHEMEL
jgi:fructokinase